MDVYDCVLKATVLSCQIVSSCFALAGTVVFVAVWTCLAG